MAGSESIQGFKRLWQGLLLQLVCQFVSVGGFVAARLLEVAGVGEETAYAIGSVIVVAALIVQMAAWVEIIAMLSQLKGVSARFTRASQWCLASFLLVLAYLVSISVSGTLQEIGVQVSSFQIAMESVVSILRFALPLVAVWTLVDGYADYLDSIGESEARLKSLHRLKSALAVIVCLQVVLSLLAAAAANLAPGSVAALGFAALAALTYPAGFCAQVVVVAKARSVWKTAEEVLS